MEGRLVDVLRVGDHLEGAGMEVVLLLLRDLLASVVSSDERAGGCGSNWHVERDAGSFSSSSHICAGFLRLHDPVWLSAYAQLAAALIGRGGWSGRRSYYRKREPWAEGSSPCRGDWPSDENKSGGGRRGPQGDEKEPAQRIDNRYEVDKEAQTSERGRAFNRGRP